MVTMVRYLGTRPARPQANILRMVLPHFTSPSPPVPHLGISRWNDCRNFSVVIEKEVRTSSPAQQEYQQLPRQPGTVTKKLRVLDDSVVQIIVEDLKSVDKNQDGRYVSIGPNRSVRMSGERF
jgi:hypothetical protein